MVDFVRIAVSKQELKIIPGIATSYTDGENEFDVIVTNESSEFASFILELSAPGLDSNAEMEWYKVNPEICAKKPPGDCTNFHVIITKPPIPAYDTNIDITLKVLSIEFTHLYALENLRLKIDKPRIPLKIYLPIKEFKISLGEVIEIPVLVENLSSELTQVELNIAPIDELDPDCFKQTNLTFDIEPRENFKKYFRCQPPLDTKIISQKYSFSITAKTDSNYNHPAQIGTLEILPHGEIHFDCPQPEQSISLFSRSATYPIHLDNRSNLEQTIEISISEKKPNDYGLKLPLPCTIPPSESKKLQLVTTKKRPWLGLSKQLDFWLEPKFSIGKASAINNTVNIYPNSKLLKLNIKPIFPMWLQLGGCLVTLLLFWLFFHRTYHTNIVNSVQFNNDATTIFSGSSDQTIGRWNVDNYSVWKPDLRRLRYEGKSKEIEQKAVRVIRQKPGKANEKNIFAIGLENGRIELWDLSSNEREDLIYSGEGNRLFALDFATDYSSYYLFSGHGSGAAYQWSLKDNLFNEETIPNPVFIDPKIKPAISSLAVSENNNNHPNSLVVLGGRYNQLALWDWKNKAVYGLKYDSIWEKINSTEESGFDPIIGQHSYIESIATADDSNLLAIADNQGYISLWDMQKVRQCLGRQANFSEPESSKPSYLPQKLACNNAIVDVWLNGHQKKPVRSVALTADGCYLASAGDDGRVMLWALNENKQRENKDGKVLKKFQDFRLNNVDIKRKDKYILIASDAPNYRVIMSRKKLIKDNKSCYED